MNKYLLLLQNIIHQRVNKIKKQNSQLLRWKMKLIIIQNKKNRNINKHLQKLEANNCFSHFLQNKRRQYHKVRMFSTKISKDQVTHQWLQLMKNLCSNKIIQSSRNKSFWKWKKSVKALFFKKSIQLKILTKIIRIFWKQCSS